MRNSKLNRYDVIYFKCTWQVGEVYLIGYAVHDTVSKKRLKTIKRTHFGKETGEIFVTSATRFYDTISEMKKALPEV